jgi:hypothetical protein
MLVIHWFARYSTDKLAISASLHGQKCRSANSMGQQLKLSGRIPDVNRRMSMYRSDSYHLWKVPICAIKVQVRIRPKVEPGRGGKLTFSVRGRRGRKFSVHSDIAPGGNFFPPGEETNQAFFRLTNVNIRVDVVSECTHCTFDSPIDLGLGLLKHNELIYLEASPTASWVHDTRAAIVSRFQAPNLQIQLHASFRLVRDEGNTARRLNLYCDDFGHHNLDKKTSPKMKSARS